MGRSGWPTPAAASYGLSRVLADTIDGEPIGKVNFVLRDSRDRIWITISTRIKNWMHALRTNLADGYIARYGNDAFRIVADGFHFTNEIRFDSDKLFVLTPEGDLRILLDEGDAAKVDALEHAFFNNHVTEDVLFDTGRGIAPWMASVTFGGRDLRTLYIGSLKGTRIPHFRVPVAGTATETSARSRMSWDSPSFIREGGYTALRMFNRPHDETPGSVLLQCRTDDVASIVDFVGRPLDGRNVRGRQLLE
jgi:hypothetical protein